MKKHSMLSPEFAIGIFGINAVVDMFAFSIKLWLANLSPEFKYWLFWIGAVFLSIGVAWGTFVLLGHKKVKWTYVLGVGAVGIVAMIFASPLLPYFFPVDPVSLAFGGDLQGVGGIGYEWLIAPIFLALVVYGIAYSMRKK